MNTGWGDIGVWHNPPGPINCPHHRILQTIGYFPSSYPSLHEYVLELENEYSLLLKRYILKDVFVKFGVGTGQTVQVCTCEGK